MPPFPHLIHSPACRPLQSNVDIAGMADSILGASVQTLLTPYPYIAIGGLRHFPKNINTTIPVLPGGPVPPTTVRAVAHGGHAPPERRCPLDLVAEHDRTRPC